ncbi:MAG: XdhC family protein, partial [Candidatus Limnocylindrales bacterium]
MRDLIDTFESWRREGVDAGRAVVVRTFGSAPRPEGAVLLVAADGRLIGSVSGGCVEGAAAEEIARARQTGMTRVIRYGISDEEAWDVGLACGGTIDVLIQSAVPQSVLDVARSSVGPRGRSAAVVTPLPGNAPPASFEPHEPGSWSAPETPIVVASDGTVIAGTAGDATTDAALSERVRAILDDGRSRTIELGDRSFFVEAFPVRPRLV